MTEIFVDTSAIYAALIVDDQAHSRARAVLTRLGQDRAVLVSHSFIIKKRWRCSSLVRVSTRFSGFTMMCCLSWISFG